MENNGVKYGLIAGLITIACFGLFYLVDVRLMLNSWLWIGSLVIYVWAMWKATVAEKEAKQERFTFRDSLKTTFLVFIIANALFYLFYYLLCNYIDPDIIKVQKEMIEASDYAKDFKDKNIDMSFSVLFFEYVKSLIGGFIIAVIVAILADRFA